MPSVFPIGVLANRCHVDSWTVPHRLSRGRELAVVHELMRDRAPTERRHLTVAQRGCDSEETEEQAYPLTMLSDVANGVRLLLARLGSEMAFAELQQWSRQQRWLDEFRDSLQARDTMTLHGRRWRYQLPFLLKCWKVARLLSQCSNVGTVVGQMLSAMLPSSCTSVAQRNATQKFGVRVVLSTLDKSIEQPSWSY